MVMYKVSFLLSPLLYEGWENWKGHWRRIKGEDGIAWLNTSEKLPSVAGGGGGGGDKKVSGD